MSDKKITIEQELEIAQKKIKELEKAADERSHEAIYAFSGKSTNPKYGVKDGMFTVRARPGEDGKAFLFRLDAMLKHLSEHGWSDEIDAAATTNATAAPMPHETQAPAQPEAYADGQTYEARALLMTVGESYTGHKPQLQFECEGLDKTINYTKDPLSFVELLHKVGGFIESDFTKGKKYRVDYLIAWRWSNPDEKGRKYRYIEAVYPNK